MDRLSILPEDVLLHILCILLGRSLDEAGLKTGSYPLTWGAHAYHGSTKSPFGALCCCNKRLSKFCKSMCESIHFSSNKQHLAEQHVAKFPNISCVSIKYAHTDQEANMIHSISPLRHLFPQLQSLVLHYEREPLLRHLARAAVGIQLVSWFRTLKRLTIHHINCRSLENTDDTSYLGENGLGFLSRLHCLQTLDLDGHSLRVSPANLSACSFLVDLKIKGIMVAESDSLDLSCCPLLQHVVCSDCSIKSLKVTGLAKLVSLNCSDNTLVSLDVSECAALTRLKCQNNRIASLVVTGNHALEVLKCEENPFLELDLTGCGLLTILDCFDCEIRELDVSTCTKLQWFRCNHARIMLEELQGCPDIAKIHVDFNYSDATRQLAVASCNGLKSVILNNCNGQYNVSGITLVDVSNCRALKQLDLYNHPALVSLLASGCNSLKALVVTNCGVWSLDLTGCSALEHLDCSACLDLDTLDVSSCVNLRNVWCRGTSIKSLDLSSAAAKLVKLNCSGCGELTRLNLSGCSGLSALDFTGCVRLQELDCGGCTGLKTLHSKNGGAFDCLKLKQFLALGA